MSVGRFVLRRLGRTATLRRVRHSDKTSLTVLAASLLVLGLVGCSASGPAGSPVDSATDAGTVDEIIAEGEAREAAVNQAAALDPRAPLAADIAKDFLTALLSRDCETFEALSTETARDLVVGEFSGPPTGYWGCKFLDWAVWNYEGYSQELEITLMDLTSELRQRDGGAHVVVMERIVPPDGGQGETYRWDLILAGDEQGSFTVDVALREKEIKG